MCTTKNLLNSSYTTCQAVTRRWTTKNIHHRKRVYNKRLKLLLFCKLSNEISHVIGGKFNPGLTTTWKRICCKKIWFNSISTHHAQQLRSNTFHLYLKSWWYDAFREFSWIQLPHKLRWDWMLSKRIIKFAYCWRISSIILHYLWCNCDGSVDIQTGKLVCRSYKLCESRVEISAVQLVQMHK